MQLFVECKFCLNLNPTTARYCKNCEKNLLNEKVTVFFVDNENDEPVNILSITHRPDDEEYLKYLNIFYYYDYIAEMNEREDYKGYGSFNLFLELYEKVIKNEKIDLKQAILKFLEMLVNVNSDSKSYSLPVQNQYNRLANFQIPPVIFGGIFYLMPKLLSEVRKDSKKHSKSLTEKLKSLNIKLNTDTLPKSLPKNIDSYPLILLMGLIQDLEKFNNSLKDNKA